MWSLENVLGLEDTFWSPWPWPRRSNFWPWPRSLKSSEIALSSAREQHYFLNCWNFVEKRQKPCGKLAKTSFYSAIGDRLKSIFKTFFAWNKFWGPFFLENTFACVLGPWSRAFLCLASRGSVFGRAVLGLGRGFFVSLASSLVSSTPPLTENHLLYRLIKKCWL